MVVAFLLPTHRVDGGVLSADTQMAIFAVGVVVAWACWVWTGFREWQLRQAVWELEAELRHEIDLDPQGHNPYVLDLAARVEAARQAYRRYRGQTEADRPTGGTADRPSATHTQVDGLRHPAYLE